MSTAATVCPACAAAALDRALVGGWYYRECRGCRARMLACAPAIERERLIAMDGAPDELRRLVDAEIARVAGVVMSARTGAASAEGAAA